MAEDKRWKNLAMIVGALIVLGIIYLVLVQPSGDITTAWKDKGLNVDYLHEDPVKVFELQESELEGIKANLAAHLNSSDRKTKLQAEIYTNYVDYMINMKKVEEINNRIDNSEKDFCDSLIDYDELIAVREAANTNLTKLNEKISEFNQEFMDESFEISLFTVKDYELQDFENLQLLKETVTSFRVTC